MTDFEFPENEGFIEKDSGRKRRLERSMKARKKRSRIKEKKSREYEDGFHGSYED